MLNHYYNQSSDKCFFSIGTMSGTSMDGIDLALIKTDGCFQVEELGHVEVNYTSEFHQLLKVAEYLICKHQGDLIKAMEDDFSKIFKEYFSNIMKSSTDKALEQLEKAVLYLHKDATMSINLSQIIHHSTLLHEIGIRKLMRMTGYNSIDVIGYHGQTLFHNPAKKITIQVGNSRELANNLNSIIISDFRSADVSLGGQGAPMAPLYHLALAVRDHKLPLAVVNCGGIANISLILTSNYTELKGYDTGPGNGLIDLFVKQRTNFEEKMDHNGKYGLKGKIHTEILDKLYAKSVLINGENYFDLYPPKSLDINNLKLIPELDNLSIEDGCATLAAFTADSIIKNLNKFTDILPKYWVLVGGGWYNPVIKRELKQRIKTKLNSEYKIYLAKDMGWNNKAIEAQIFAYLAVRTLKSMPISIHETTGTSLPNTFAKLTISNVNDSMIPIPFKNHQKLEHYHIICRKLKNLLFQEKLLNMESEHVCFSIILNNIAEIYKYINKHNNAIEYYKKAYAYQKTFNNNLNIIDNLMQLGMINHKLRKYTSTLMYYGKALNALQCKLNPLTGNILIRIAQVYNTLNLNELAINYYSQAIKAYQGYYGDHNIQLASIFDEIANIYQNEDQYQLAIQYYTKALKILQYNYNNYENINTSEINNILAKLEIANKKNHECQSSFTDGKDSTQISITRFYRKYSL